MNLSDLEILGFVCCAVLLICDALLGRLPFPWYYRFGIPVARFTLPFDVEEVARRAEEVKSVRLLVRVLSERRYGIRYGFLGNWLPSLTKVMVRPDQHRSIRIGVSLNWGCTLLLTGLLTQLLLRQDRLLFLGLLAAVLLMVWLQYDEMVRALQQDKARQSDAGRQ
jgi:hypothetical protein